MTLDDKEKFIDFLKNYTKKNFDSQLLWEYEFKDIDNYSFSININNFEISVKYIHSKGNEYELISIKSPRGGRRDCFENNDRRNFLSEFLYDLYINEKLPENLFEHIMKICD